MLRPAVLLACLSLVGTVGCGPKLVRETVSRSEAVLVQLRHTVSGGKPLPRGHAHPAVISSVRLAHILATLSHEDSEGERGPTIRSEHVYELGEGMASAFARAGPDDEVVGVAYAHDRRLAIFTAKRVTAFRAWVEAEGDLVLEFFAIERDLSRDTPRAQAKPWEPPVEPPREAPDFELIPGDAQRARGARGVAVAWRDDVFRQPQSLRIRGGKLHRRRVLLEAPVEEQAGPTAAPLPANLSDAQRRALDQLDAARRSGLVRETEYQRRRMLILQGRLDEAGYGEGEP